MRWLKSWVGKPWIISVCCNVQTTITVPGVNICLKEVVLTLQRKWEGEKENEVWTTICSPVKWSRSVSKGALNPDKVFTWVFGVHVNLRCRVSFSAQSVLGSGSKSVHLLCFVSSLLFLSFRILKAEIVECLNNINCVFYFNLSTKFLFQGKQLHNVYFPWLWFGGGTD